MGSGFQLYGPGQLANHWDIAGNGEQFPSDHRDSLLALVDRRHKLQAPVYFQVPDGKWSDPRWQEIITASQPQCRCLTRRVLVPETGRARFVPQDSPLTAVMGQPGSTLDSGDAYVLVIPHGGDDAAAHMSWSFDRDLLVCTELPLHSDRPQQQSITFGQTGSPNYQNGVMRFEYAQLVETIRRRGEVICYRTLSTGTDRVTVPVCSITSVRRDRNNDIFVGVELDAGVNHRFVRSDEPPPLHTCAA